MKIIKTIKIISLVWLVLVLTFWGQMPVFAENLNPVVSHTFEEDEREFLRLPIVMYHSVLNKTKGTYIVSETQLENDIIALENAGYTTVFPSDIIQYINKQKRLPEKPIMLTFDDGHYNNMYYALPILKKYNSKALINIIGKFSENSSTSGDASNPNYSHLTWAQIKELSISGCFEIGNHSYNMHNFKPRFGVKQKYGESNESYCNCLTKDITLLQNKIKTETGITPKVFAYPFGEYCNTARDILLQEGFEMMLTCNEGVSTIKKGDPSSLYYLKRYNRAGYYSTVDVLKRVETGKIKF